MICSTPAIEDPCQWEMITVRNSKLFQGHSSTGKSAHVNRDIDAHYDVIKVYVPGEFRELISVEQDGDDYIRPNADLEIKPHIRSEEQQKCMYSEYWNRRVQRF